MGDVDLKGLDRDVSFRAAKFLRIGSMLRLALAFLGQL